VDDDFRRVARQRSVEDRRGHPYLVADQGQGFRNVIHWTVTHCDAPKSVELPGRGRGGIRIAVSLCVTEDEPGSTFHLVANLSGGLLSGRIGKLVARVLRSDVRKSVNNLAALK
jgi:hypothetical protein